MSDRGRVGLVARVLGFAGLLPQVAALVWIALAPDVGPGVLLAQFYPLLILSFLGGIWWGFAMRRAIGQGQLATIAIVPSLIALALFCAAVASLTDIHRFAAWQLVTTGVVILLTLPIDRYLIRTGDAPDGWMQLRAPLSIGLGVLTIAAAILIGR